MGILFILGAKTTNFSLVLSFIQCILIFSPQIRLSLVLDPEILIIPRQNHKRFKLFLVISWLDCTDGLTFYLRLFGPCYPSKMWPTQMLVSSFPLLSHSFLSFSSLKVDHSIKTCHFVLHSTFLFFFFNDFTLERASL